MTELVVIEGGKQLQRCKACDHDLDADGNCQCLPTEACERIAGLISDAA